MNPNVASTSIKFRVGLFTILGLCLIGAVTVFVNDKPFWWRSCNLVNINIEDATGLKTKSPVRSLGLEIGYLKTVELHETHVRLGICVTAPVEILDETKAYIRGEGFLGDKFVELKPVKFVGNRTIRINLLPELFISSAFAEEPAPAPRQTDIPVGEKNQDVQKVVERVDDLVKEMTSLTTNIKNAIDPNELKQTMRQLNKTLENASRTLAPEGNLNTTAQRTLAKLEDAIEQMRDQMTRINHGEGSLGMLLNDPTYAEEVKKALKNLNQLLNKVGSVRFEVEMGAVTIPAHSGTRGYATLGIWPSEDRYYRLGITIDPRGKKSEVQKTTVTNAGTSVETITEIDQGGLLLTFLLGKVFFKRIDLSVGVLHGDGTVSANLLLGPGELRHLVAWRNDIYSRGKGSGIDDRSVLRLMPLLNVKPFNTLWVEGGFESTKKNKGKVSYLYGAGLTFDDEDIKLLFTLK